MYISGSCNHFNACLLSFVPEMRLWQSWSCSQVSIFNISAWEVLVFAQTFDYSQQSIQIKNCPLTVWHMNRIYSLLAVSLLANLWSVYSLRKRAFHLYPWPPCHHRFSCPGLQCPLVVQWALPPKSGCHKHAWRKTKSHFCVSSFHV